MTQSLVSSSDNNPPQGLTRGGGPGVIKSVGSQLQTNVTNITSSLTPEAFAASAGIIVLIAIVGSAVPAWSIARIRPAEVLRTE
jgi:ABC-type antimicrobial peptide transport system permease subunit